MANVQMTEQPAASVSMEEPVVDVIRQLRREERALSRDGEDNGQQPPSWDMTTIIMALSKRVERLQA